MTFYGSLRLSSGIPGFRAVVLIALDGGKERIEHIREITGP